MITGRDILYLWIVRMIMTSLEFTGDIPFRQVLVHPTVLNIEGRRMSKSLGTGVDPLDLISQYGSDATRFSLLYQCASDQDLRFGEERTEMARNFCNKIWNASRFLLMNLPDGFQPADDISDRVRQEGSLAQRWILSRYVAMLSAAEAALESYEMAEAARALYEFFWSEFCDWFVEISKLALRAGGSEADRARQLLWFVLERTLRALHPFMPFITEEVWEQLPATGEMLIQAPWPQPDPAWRDVEAEQDMEALMQVVTTARKLRAEQRLPPDRRVAITVASGSDRAHQVLSANEDAVLLLAKGASLSLARTISAQPALSEVVTCFGEPALISIDAAMSPEELEQHRRRLERELAQLQQEEGQLRAKLDNADFCSRAPAAVVEKTRARHEAARERRDAIQAQLASLTGSQPQ
jgi:valyl-tRNA synthetase